MKKKKVLQQIEALFLAILLFIGTFGGTAKAGGSLDEDEEILFLPWYFQIDDTSVTNLWQSINLENEPEPFVFEYGGEQYTLECTRQNIRGETKCYYLYRGMGLPYGWSSGATIKLLNVPAPDGYVTCFSGTPELRYTDWWYYEANPTIVEAKIPVIKKGEKFPITSSAITTKITEEFGIRVFHYNLPLTEGLDYTVSYGKVSNGKQEVIIHGCGNYSGSRTIGSVASSETPSTEKPSDSTDSTDSKKPSDSTDSTDSKKPTDSGDKKKTTYKVGDKFWAGKYRYEIIKLSGKKGNVALIGAKSSVTAIKMVNTVKKNGYTFTVTEIGEAAFKNNDKIKSLVTNTALNVIGKEAFCNCTNLGKITLKKGLKKIGKKAFYNCKKLKDIVLPSTINSIGDEAFASCKKMSSATLNEGLKTIGAGAFRQCVSLKKIVIPSTVTVMKKNAFKNTYSLYRMEIHSKVMKKIGKGCFEGCGSKVRLDIVVPTSEFNKYKTLLQKSYS